MALNFGFSGFRRGSYDFYKLTGNIWMMLL
jgi:hypothetical protein